MPIYEYCCKNCGVFEVTQRITENPLAACPTCEGEVHRLISLTSFVLKGNGWYATDYARSNGKGESPAESTGKADDGAGSSGKVESAAGSNASPTPSSTDSSKSDSSKGSSEKSEASKPVT
jgi:putative FmdB family regulatory protein